jgi:hypothetical protein
MRFSDQFNLNRAQSELDFVDVPLDTDIRVFIDPYALATTKTPWCAAGHALAYDFFQQVLNKLRAGDRAGALVLLGRLREDNRTRLGYSEDEPQGSGLGDDRAGPFLDALESSEAFQTGRIEDIEDAALFVEGIGFDIVSDMVTNVLREHLAAYTQDQCRLLGIPMAKRETFEAWRAGTGWTTVTMDLPTDGVRAILLVPRAVVRKDLSLEPNQYLTDFLDHYYENGNPRAVTALEQMLQNVPTKNNGKQVHRGKLRDDLKKKGSRKNVMAKITNAFPEALRGYKGRARENRPVLTPGELESIHPQGREDDISNLIAELRGAARNANDVMALAQRITAGLVSAFHPVLQHPRPLDGSVNGFAGVVMSNVAPKGLLWNARHNGGPGERPNVVVLASNVPITAAALSHVDARALCANTSSGVVMLVGPSIDAATQARRRELARTGVFVMSTPELAAIAEVEAGADVALDALDALVAA